MLIAEKVISYLFYKYLKSKYSSDAFA